MVIARRVHHAHAATPEHSLDLEAIAEQPRSARQRRGDRAGYTVGEVRDLA
jgi:hypothetical protein